MKMSGGGGLKLKTLIIDIKNAYTSPYTAFWQPLEVKSITVKNYKANVILYKEDGTNETITPNLNEPYPINKVLIAVMAYQAARVEISL